MILGIGSKNGAKKPSIFNGRCAFRPKPMPGIETLSGDVPGQ
jgi:hypothetical protein